MKKIKLINSFYKGCVAVAILSLILSFVDVWINPGGVNGISHMSLFGKTMVITFVLSFGILFLSPFIALTVRLIKLLIRWIRS